MEGVALLAARRRACATWQQADAESEKFCFGQTTPPQTLHGKYMQKFSSLSKPRQKPGRGGGGGHTKHVNATF